MRLTVTMALTVLTPNIARAECAWGDKVESISATMTTVTVNGQVFPVRGTDARSAFMATMRECGASESTIDAFEEWRSLRQWTNTSAGAACCLVFPIVATPVTAFAAGEAKKDLLELLPATNA
jgi:hypothetical protein